MLVVILVMMMLVMHVMMVMMVMMVLMVMMVMMVMIVMMVMTVIMSKVKTSAKMIAYILITLRLGVALFRVRMFRTWGLWW